jgi:hypothetical protein
MMSGFRKLIPIALAFAMAAFLQAGVAVAGPNSAAVPSLDFVGTGASSTGNQTDDAVLTGTVSDSGTVVVVEVFAAGIAAAIQGVDIQFEIDQTFVKVTGGSNPSFPFAIPTAAGLSLAGTGTVTPTNGYLARAEFTTQKDVTGTEFTIGIKQMTLASASGTDTVLTTSKISFNASPKLAADAMYDITKPIPLPVNGSVSVTVTATGFAAGATLTWTVTEAAGSTATITTSEAGDANTITAAGPGSATVTVSASDGTASTNDVSITFSQQEPAELASFGGELVDDRVVVTWSTASQTNNAGWQLLRSVDGENYEAIGEFVQGAGTSDALLSYNLQDNDLPSVEKVYYRLEQVDLDGSVSRSNPVEVLLGARMPVPTEFATSVYPNPFNPSTTISYDMPNEAFVSVVIYDAIGQEVRRLVSEQAPAGRYRVQWDALDSQGRAVGSGVYIAKVEAGSFSNSQKMLLLK